MRKITYFYYINKKYLKSLITNRHVKLWDSLVGPCVEW